MTTLTLDPQFPWTVEPLTGNRADRGYGAGQIPIGVLHKTEVRRWRISLDLATNEARQSVETAQDAVKGGSGTVDWTPPGAGSPVKVRFLPGTDGYSRERLTAGLWRLSVNVEEALGL